MRKIKKIMSWSGTPRAHPFSAVVRCENRLTAIIHAVQLAWGDCKTLIPLPTVVCWLAPLGSVPC
jgi:hypothetical protein